MDWSAHTPQIGVLLAELVGVLAEALLAEQHKKVLVVLLVVQQVQRKMRVPAPDQQVPTEPYLLSIPMCWHSRPEPLIDWLPQVPFVHSVG